MSDLAEFFLALEYEATVNGNCNFCIFPVAAVRFRECASRLLEAIEPRIEPEVFQDDDDGVCLLMSMIDEDPHSLPAEADGQYQALRRVLIRLGILNDEQKGVNDE